MEGYPLKTPADFYIDNPVSITATDLILAWQNGRLGALEVAGLVAFLVDTMPISDAVNAALASVLDGAPASLDTLNELAAALGDDANFASTVMAAIAGKLAIDQNLNDLTDKAAARGNLGANDAANLTAGLLAAARVPATLTADKAFRRGNILGTVSQAAGVPTGALVQSGGTAGGWLWERYASGRQDVWYDAGYGITATSDELMIVPLTWPVAFVGSPAPNLTLKNITVTNGFTMKQAYLNAGVSGGSLVFQATATSQQQYQWGISVTGRWF